MLSIQKMKALYSVFQAGKSVADPAKWKLHQLSANAIAAFLFALVQLAKAFGYDLGIDMQTCADIAIGVLALVNVCLTVASTKHIGLPSGKVREAESHVSGNEPAEPEESTEVQAEDAPDSGRGTASSTIDDDVRNRAIEWARQHSATNGLSNDA